MAPDSQQGPQRLDETPSSRPGGEQNTTPSMRQRMGGYTPLKSGSSVAATPVQLDILQSTGALEQAPLRAVRVTAAAAATGQAGQISVTGLSARPAAPPDPAVVGQGSEKQRMGGYTPLKSGAAVMAGSAPPVELSSAASRPSAVALTEAAAPDQHLGGLSAVNVLPVEQDPSSAQSPQQAQLPVVAASSEAQRGTDPTAAESPSNPATRCVEGTPEEKEKSVLRTGRRRVTAIVGVVLVALTLVLVVRWLRTTEPVQQFIAAYPGHSTLPKNAPGGIPGWMGWQHFLNLFFIVLIVRTGLQVRTEKRPPGYWTPKENSFFSPKGNSPMKVSLSQWLHQVLDVLWVANGAIFVILLAMSGQWMRIVPTHWDVIPNMASTALQYASLDWPEENGWIHYNALQMVSYFLVVYVAAPLAVLSGWRMSTWWPARATTLSRIYPVQAARKLHFPVMLFFSLFTVVHVFLVFFTGALKNLNHMYTSRDVADGWGLVIFVVSVAVVAAGWYLTQPVFTIPLAGKTGKISKN